MDAKLIAHAFILVMFTFQPVMLQESTTIRYYFLSLNGATEIVRGRTSLDAATSMISLLESISFTVVSASDACTIHATTACSINGVCTPTSTSKVYECACKEGNFIEQRGPSSFSCLDVNECDSSSLNNCNDLAECTNTPGSFGCACRSGYSGDGITECIDVNECEMATSDCSGLGKVCVNTEGSYTCQCSEGFSANGVACEDIDECSNETVCQNGDCTNTVGSFSCECNPGFVRRSEKCMDIDECADETLNNCDNYATCDNRPGSFSCSCNSGFTGSGTSCTDIDECLSGPCHVNAVCSNVDGSFSCACREGFDGDGTNCEVPPTTTTSTTTTTTMSTPSPPTTTTTTTTTMKTPTTTTTTTTRTAAPAYTTTTTTTKFTPLFEAPHAYGIRLWLFRWRHNTNAQIRGILRRLADHLSQYRSYRA